MDGTVFTWIIVVDRRTRVRGGFRGNVCFVDRDGSFPIVEFGCEVLISLCWDRVATGDGKAGVVSGLCFIADKSSEIPEWREAGMVFFFVSHAVKHPPFLQVVGQLLHYGPDTSGGVQVC